MGAPSACPTHGVRLVRPRDLPPGSPPAQKASVPPPRERTGNAGTAGTADNAGNARSGVTGLPGSPSQAGAGVATVSLVDDDPMVGRTLEGRYTILTKLGAGSMGTVYRAKQHAMGREVAIKILRGDRADDESAKARFMREARANSLLASPNTVTVFDFGQSESGEFYLAMELLEGESLGQRLTTVGRLPAALAVDAARQALRSLGEAHAKGIIHRDLKPDNLFFARVLTGNSIRPSRLDPSEVNGQSTPPPPAADPHEEIVKVLDFGIAKMMDPDAPQPMGVVETQAGTVFGTPRYMSPEQAQGKPLDARSDLYSLGVILYQMLAGRPPFTDNDAVVVMARHIKSTPKPLREVCPDAAVPKELEDVVMRTLAKDPRDRPESAEILAGELLSALEAADATSSGVRASITNAAGIRIPGSIRPPSIPLPKARRKKLPLVAAAIAVPLVVIAAALGVYIGLRKATTTASNATVSTDTTSVSGKGASRGSDPANHATVTNDGQQGDDEPPTVTPDALPRAVSGGAVSAGAASGSPKVHGRPLGRPQRATPAGKASASTPTSAPSPTSSYGIFD